jgi:hypothetical protein
MPGGAESYAKAVRKGIVRPFIELLMSGSSADKPTFAVTAQRGPSTSENIGKLSQNLSWYLDA